MEEIMKRLLEADQQLIGVTAKGDDLMRVAAARSCIAVAYQSMAAREKDKTAGTAKKSENHKEGGGKNG